jgi:putative transposase
LTSIGKMSMNGEKALTDERISGTDDFVEGVLGEADRWPRRSFASWVREKQVKRFIEEKCEKEGISVKELQLGAIAGRSLRVARIWLLIWPGNGGLPSSEIARQLAFRLPPFPR